MHISQTENFHPYVGKVTSLGVTKSLGQDEVLKTPGSSSNYMSVVGNGLPGDGHIGPITSIFLVVFESGF